MVASRRGRSLWVQLLALLTAGMGVVNLLSASSPSERNRLAMLREVFPPFVWETSRLFVAVAGVFLLMLARGIGRHKRHAWEIAVVLLSVSTITHMSKGLDWEESSLSALMVVALALNRSSFRAASDIRSVQNGVFAVAIAAAFSFIYGVLGFYYLDRHFHESFSFLDAARVALRDFFMLVAPPTPYSRLARWFLDSIQVVSVTSIGAAMWLVLRPAVYRRTVQRAEMERAMVILKRYGRSSYARFTVWDDKALFFGADGDSFVSYKVVGDIALVLGDPICPVDRIPGMVAQFASYCRDNDWMPAFYQTLDDTVDLYRDAGMQVLKIGDEAIVDLSTWTMQGGGRKNMRNLVSKFTKGGYRFEVLQPPYADALLSELGSVSTEWLGSKHGAEKTFSLGYFSKSYVSEGAVAVVRNQTGAVVAFANLIPTYASSEGTFDMMRHRKSAPSGIMEFLLVELANWLQAQGCSGFNLGLAPLSGIGDAKDSAVLERGIRLIYQYLNQFYNFRGLRMFKEKFDPVWSPRYLAYPGVASLVRVSYAVVNANSGGRLRDYLKRAPAAEAPSSVASAPPTPPPTTPPEGEDRP